MNSKQEFIRIFRNLSERHSAWSVWRDFIFVSAAAISNRFDKRPGVWHKRENEYLKTVRQYDKNERNDIPMLLALTTKALCDNPVQDFLGTLFMELELSNHWKGQFFTPYSVADMMTHVTTGDGESVKEKVSQEGYISVNDPACGSGVMLIAFANRCRELGLDPSKDVLLVGQDIDETAALMCYIQMSLLNCAGYVAVGNSLTEPVKGTPLRPVYKRENLWFTPGYLSQPWVWRWMKGR